MSTTNDDGHHPLTCNYQRCNADVDTPCPFVKDEVVAPQQPQCAHEWRQYWMVDWPNSTTAIPDGWFCVFCKTIEQ